MDIAALAGPGRRPACWDKPEAFSNPALDYDPRAEEYRHLDILGHTILKAHKAAAEEAAVDVCFGCPLMLACEKMDTDTSRTSTTFISGVIGGRTETERRARLRGTTRSTTGPIPNPQIAPGDRGPRNQVDDDLIARLTLAGRTSEQIAAELGCSPRTVSRARRRKNLTGLNHAPATTTPATPADAPVPAVTVTVPVAVAVEQPAGHDTDTLGTFQALTTAELAHATHRAEQTLSRGPRPHTTTATTTGTADDTAFVNRPVSAAMEAIYIHLATHGGTDTLDNLLNVGIPAIDPDEALEWWTRYHSTTLNGIRTVRPGKANTPLSDRIHDGARAKVLNSISATARKNRHLTRDTTTDTFTLKPDTYRAWADRLATV